MSYYFKSVICFLIVSIFSCKKNDVLKESVFNEATPSPQIISNTALRPPSSLTPITARPDGTFEGNGIIFGSIVYKLGSYQTGEPVHSIIITALPVQGAAVTELSGPVFSYAIPTIGFIFNANFRTNFKSYMTAWNLALNGQGSLPYLSDYIGETYSNPGGTTYSGVVVRDVNSPSTFSIASASYTLVKTTSTPTNRWFGLTTINGYKIKLSEPIPLALSGNVARIEVSDQNNVAVNVRLFQLQYQSIQNGDKYHVTGTITLSNGFVISINEDIWSVV